MTPRDASLRGPGASAWRCKAVTGLAETWHEVETTVQQEWIERDASRLASLTAACDKRLATARRVLSD